MQNNSVRNVSSGRELSALQTASLQVLAGGSAGFVEVLLMQPLDVVKTRMQLSNKVAVDSPLHHSKNPGVFRVFHRIYSEEGFLAFWKGILPPVLAETPKRAIKFVCFEQLKPLFLFGAQSPTPLSFSLAGLSAGLIEAVAVNPFEVVKVTQQADRRRIQEMQSSWSIAREIIQRDGLGRNGLNKGITATLGRNGIFNMIYFGFYNSMKDSRIWSSRNESSSSNPPSHQLKELLRKIVIGFASGVLGSVANIPFDVAKSRIQGPQPVPGHIKYRTTLATISIIYREEGFRALYKGLVPKIMRLGPGGAIMLLVFDYVFDFLKSTYQ